MKDLIHQILPQYNNMMQQEMMSSKGRSSSRTLLSLCSSGILKQFCVKFNFGRFGTTEKMYEIKFHTKSLPA